MKELLTAEEISAVLSTARRYQMSLNAIYGAVKKLRMQQKRPVPVSLDAEIRNTLQRHCAACPQFSGDERFAKLGSGVWGLMIKPRKIA